VERVTATRLSSSSRLSIPACGFLILHLRGQLEAILRDGVLPVIGSGHARRARWTGGSDGFVIGDIMMNTCVERGTGVLQWRMKRACRRRGAHFSIHD